MTTHRFSTGTLFRWQDTLYEVKRLLPNQEINFENVASGAVLVKPLTELINAWMHGELVFTQASKLSNDTRAANQKRAGVDLADLGDYPAELVAVARWRLSVIQPLIDLAPEQRTLKVVTEWVQALQTANEQSDGNGPRSLQNTLSCRSVYRWMHDYLDSGDDLRALIPATRKRGGKGVSRLNLEVSALVDAVIRDHYYRPEVVTVKDLLAIIAARIADENRVRPPQEQLQLPHANTIVNRIDALDMREKFAARHGKRAAKRQFAQYGQTEYPTMPLERVEIDHTSTDLVVVDEQTNLPLGRLTLTYALDMATRYPLGRYVGFEPPSYYAVMECLYHCILPKGNVQERYGTEHDWIAYGIPALLMVDNGREFIGQDLADAGAVLGFVVQQAPVQTPWFKAGVERALRSTTALFHGLPGTTFSNPRQRGDYDSTKQACITLSDLDRALTLFTVDVYAESFHRGLGGIPARRWEQSVQNGFSPRVTAGAEELAILLGRVERRMIQHYGVELFNLRYNCTELALLRHRLKGEPAKVKYHPGDLSRIYVRDPFDERYVSVPALDQDYTRGLSLWAHRVVCEFVRREQDRVDLAALGRAKLKIQEIVDAARSRKRSSTQRKVARWEESGQPPSLTGQTQASGPAGPPAPPTGDSPSDPHVAPPPRNSDARELPGQTGSAESQDSGWELSYRLLVSTPEEVTHHEAE